MTSHRRYFAPEVIQTSAMDCGPATLKCLLDGYGIPASYGRLREACQTEVDGTSIDTIEEIAGVLGLQAEQVLLPLEHLLLEEAAPLPCLLIVKTPGGATHFVVAWRRHGRWVQCMDPAHGRRWVPWRALLADAYIHEMSVPAELWEEWARSDGFLGPFRGRLRRIGGPEAEAQVDAAIASPGWFRISALDAATRVAERIVASGCIGQGRDAARLMASLVARELRNPERPAGEGGSAIPDNFWFARPDASTAGEMVVLRGAVGLLVRGRARRADASDGAEIAPVPDAALNRELRAVLHEPRPRPLADCARLLRGSGGVAIAAVALGTLVVAAAVAFEGLLFRGLLDVAHDLTVVTQRVGAFGLLVSFLVLQLAVELGVVAGALRLGRQLEIRMRAAFLDKIPRLEDRYFGSRPISDMGERAHSVHELRGLPPLVGRLARVLLTFFGIVGGIAWLDARAGLAALGAALVAAALPLFFKVPLDEAELRQRTHRGALCQFFLDGLIGLGAARAHGAERTIRREHEGLLVEWAGASQRLLTTVLRFEALSAMVGVSGAVVVVFAYCLGTPDPVGALLLAYWALHLPVLGEELGYLVRQIPIQRNAALRVLEPLGAPEDREESERSDTPLAAEAPDPERPGVAIEMQGVEVRAAGHTILEDLDLAIEPGEHIAVVGPSGAGKSSLVGLLLGFHRPTRGEIRVDGENLTGARLDELRRQTAWVDPAVHLWNRSLLENVGYGAPEGSGSPGPALESADVRAFLGTLPAGLQSPLGEGGAAISGGEGQRVRFARGLHRDGARLVILDEPFRGLDRESRRRLLGRARDRFAGATLILVTHDVDATLGFDRVLVIEEGRVAEDGSPSTLAALGGSRYRAILKAERSVHAELWSHRAWRRLRVEGGRAVESPTTLEGPGTMPGGGTIEGNGTHAARRVRPARVAGHNGAIWS